MKKLLSLILALSMLVSVAPAAFAAPVLELADTAVEPVMEEPITEEPLTEKAPVLLPADVEITPEEEIPAETLYRRAKADAKAEAEAGMALSSDTNLDETDLELMASSYKVTVKVKFPHAATEDGTIRIALFQAATVDSTGFVSSAPASYTSVNISVDAGDTSASTSFTVPAGNYIPAVYPYTTAIGSTPYQYVYFNKDGTAATNAYTAESVRISAAKTVTVTLPKAERTISGTVHFSEALTEDTEFEISFEDSSRYSNTYSYCYYWVKKGSTSFDFSLPVAAGSYSLEIRNYQNDYWGYYDNFGSLTSNRDSCAYVSVYDSSVSDLRIDGDILLGESGSEPIESTAHRVDVTVKLPEEVNGYKRYFVLLYVPQYNELWDYSSYTISNGFSAEEISATFWLEEDMEFSVGYLDVTNYSSFSWTDYYPGQRYLTEDDGITSLVENAQVFTMGTKDMSVTIDDTSNYKMTGTLKLGSARSTDSAVFAMAEFANGETFGARVYLPAGDTSESYVIYVPKTQSGSFAHYAADATGGRGVILNEESRVDGDTYTVKNKLSLSTLTMPSIIPNVTGTVSLPSGIKAPEGGLAMQFQINGSNVGYYYMDEGESSISFSFAAALEDDNTDNRVRVTLQNPPDNLANMVTLYGEYGDDMMDLSIAIPETVLVSGTISVPQSAKDLGTTFEVYTYGSPEGYSNINNYTYISILPGETSAYYQLKALKNIETDLYVEVTADATGKVLSATQYLQEDGSFDIGYTDVTLSEDITSNVIFGAGQSITGTISLASGLPAGEYYGYVRAEPDQGGDDYSTYISLNGTSVDYSLAVPLDYTGTWRVYVYLYEGASNAMIDTSLYYSNTGVTTNYSDAALITAPADDIDFVIPKARVISGTVIFPDEFQGYEIWGNAYAIDSDYNYYNSYISNYDTLDYTIKVPTDYTGTYKLAVYLRSDDNVPGLITRTYLYLTEDGTLSTDMDKAEEFSVGDDGLQQDLTVPLGKSINVTLNAPEGFSGDYNGRLYLYDLSTYNEVARNDFYFDGTSTTVSLSLPADSTGSYTLRIIMYTGLGTVTNNYYYYNNGTWVTSTSNITPIDLSQDLSVTLPQAKIISGKLVSSQGDPVQLGEDSVSFSIYDSSGSYVDNRSTIDADGNFTVMVADDLTGKFRMYCYPGTAAGSNVVTGKSYHYKSDATSSVTDYTRNDETYFFEIGEEDVSGLSIYVDTGYVMTGTVKLGTGATLSGTNSTLARTYVYLTNPTTHTSYSANVRMTKDATSWEYSIVVPKESVAYDMTSYININDGTTSNLYTGTVDHGSVTVTGSAALPDIIQLPGKHTVRVTLTMPANDSVSGYLYMKTGSEETEKQYETSFYLEANGSATYNLVTTPNETAGTYQLYYYAYNADGIIDYEYIYLTADGTLTTDESQAGNFSFDTTAHSITLMEQAPYATGKIYIPDCVDDEEFYIQLDSNDYASIWVSDDTIKKESDGRKYVPYALYSDYITPGETSFYLCYYLSSYNGSALFNTSNYSYRAYVAADGEIVYGSSNSYYFTVPASGVFNLDFTLATWDDGAEENLLQSAHGINNATDELTYTFTYPGATWLAVTFNNRTDTDVTINNQKYYYYYLQNSVQYIDVSETSGTMTISVEAPYSDRYYGFGIVSIVPYYGSEAVTVPTITSVYTEGGSDESIIMADLQDGKAVFVSMAAPAETSGTMIAAVYDSDGKMLDAAVSHMTFEEEYASAMLEFDQAEDAVKLQIMFVNAEWTPVMSAKIIAPAS